MKTVCEYCNNCETEVVMEWDVAAYGYKAYCPFCGARLMLCDECMHPNGELDDSCDYDCDTDTCKWSKIRKKRNMIAGWTPVTEDTPKTDDVVFVTVKSEPENIALGGRYDSETKKWFVCALEEVEVPDNLVVAWMPIPKPYKRQEDTV